MPDVYLTVPYAPHVSDVPMPLPIPMMAAVILAAGKSTRMKSKIVKVLHPIAGVPMIRYAVSNVASIDARRIVLVVGHGGQQVRDAIGDAALFVEQREQMGTGHALLQARPLLEGQAGTILCLYGDMPLIRPQTLQRLIAAHQKNEAVMSLVTLGGDDSMGFGHIVRTAAGAVQSIVEEKVATPAELAIKEYNAGIYCFQSEWLWPRLASLPVSAAGEYYLTDMLAVAVREGKPVASIQCSDVSEVLGINNRVQLAQAESIVRAAVCRNLMLNGVTIVDPAATYIDATVRIAADTVVYPNTIIQGETRIGEDCQIGPNSQIRNSVIGNACRVLASVLEESVMEDGANVGPFSHLRSGARVGKKTYIGNFAEVKNSSLGEHVHMGHFSYLGDATIGDNVNVSAGIITCNFDGTRKNQTVVEDGAFLGSDTLLIAPVKVGKKARTGAGSVVTHDLPADTLSYGVPARVIKKNE
jgi:bifunctional UDP-N-acetylglucosamine pyrophosphorylase / glucosamine-1-phosphate N-acetyltransferase